MFDEILKMVKDHFGNHPDVAALPADQQDAIHNEIATHVANSVASQPAVQEASGTVNNETAIPAVANNLISQPAAQGVASGLLGKLENAVASGGTMVSAIEGGLVGSLASKFGLPPSITGAIAGALPGLLQKIATKAKSPVVN
jgi:hypothetical protein